MADGEGREQGTAGNPSPARLLLLEVAGSGEGRGHRAPGLGRQGTNTGEGARAPGVVDEGDALVVEVTGGGAPVAGHGSRGEGRWLGAENEGGGRVGRAERWIWEDPDGDGEWVAAARWEKMDGTDPRTRVWTHIYIAWIRLGATSSLRS